MRLHVYNGEAKIPDDESGETVFRPTLHIDGLRFQMPEAKHTISFPDLNADRLEDEYAEAALPAKMELMKAELSSAHIDNMMLEELGTFVTQLQARLQHIFSSLYAHRDQKPEMYNTALQLIEDAHRVLTIPQSDHTEQGAQMMRLRNFYLSSVLHFLTEHKGLLQQNHPDLLIQLKNQKSKLRHAGQSIINDFGSDSEDWT